MKILDKYVAKSFLTGYLIAFCVLIGLRIIIDLFVNLDEFSEHANLGTLAVAKNILSYYAIHCTLYFRDFAGMIIVVAAAFSLGKMVRYNELTAIMASGVTLKRIIAPIIVLATILTALLVIDQELIIPPLSDKLVRGQDCIPGQEKYDVWFIADANGSLLCSGDFDVKTATFTNPTIITRKRIPNSSFWKSTGWLEAKKAAYDPKNKSWLLTEGSFTPIPDFNDRNLDKISRFVRKPVPAYPTDITPKDIPVRRRAENKTLLSFRQLSALQAQGTKIKDIRELASQKHFRVTDPVMNLVLLMVCLPVLVCRDPRAMKSAILTSFLITAACLVTNFTCKLLATETVLGITKPQFWAWLPVFIFAPIAFIELDSMKS